MMDSLPDSPSPPTTYDVVVVGAGLAGACAALALADDRAVLLVDRDGPAAGASGAAAGLVNPFMARKARQVWRAAEALDALDMLVDRIDRRELYDATGLLRPARDPKQAAAFRETAAEFPDETDWRTGDELRTAYPDLQAPYGGLHIAIGGSVPVAAFVRAIVDTFVERGGAVRFGAALDGWTEDRGRVDVALADGQVVRARTLLLALGYGHRHFPELTALGLHGVKGETIIVDMPRPVALPNLAGTGYVVPDDRGLTLGSTYDHEFTDVRPTQAGAKTILDKTSRMVPMLAEARVVEARSGVRVTVPGDRLPMLGPLRPGGRVWVFTGLGSKGLLTAPWLASLLPAALDDPTTLPPEVVVR